MGGQMLFNVGLPWGRASMPGTTQLAPRGSPKPSSCPVSPPISLARRTMPPTPQTMSCKTCQTPGLCLRGQTAPTPAACPATTAAVAAAAAAAGPAGWVAGIGWPTDTAAGKVDLQSALPAAECVACGIYHPTAAVHSHRHDAPSPRRPQQTHQGPTSGEPMFLDWQLDYCLRVAVAQGHLDTCRCLVAAGASGAQVRALFGWAGRGLFADGWCRQKERLWALVRCCYAPVCTYAGCHSCDLPSCLHPSGLPTCSCAVPGARPRGGRRS